MKLKFSIDLETPPWLTKAIVVAVPIIVILGVTFVVAATPHNFATPPMQVLQARDLNSLNAVLDDAGIQQYSVGATTFCGISSAHNGSLGGYVGARARCLAPAVAGCGTTAHMCTTEEIVRSAQLGIVPPVDGWVSAGVLIGSDNDCQGWFTACSGTGCNGAVWRSAASTGNPQGSAGIDSCSGPLPVLCCD